MTADRYQLKDALVSGVSQMESDEQCKSRYDGLGEEFRGMCVYEVKCKRVCIFDIPY